VDGELLALLERNYTLVGSRRSVVAGRAATMVAAYRGGAVQARWWLDDKTGVLLWQETYDATGAPELAFGFTAVAVSRTAGILEHLPPRLAVPVTDAALSLSNAGELRAADWTCQPELAGLSLIRVRSDRVTDPSTLHLVYSDGVDTVSVFEQRGRLDAVPSGSQWDAAAGAYLRPGASSLATWQSKDRVFSVITDGSPDLLARAVAALPHQRADRPSTMERIKTGWAEILADVRS
jgi:negative regulator of sigma E activity